jgi:hypothetical protein
LLGFRSEQTKWQQSVTKQLDELSEEQRRAVKAGTEMRDDVRTLLRGQPK